MSIEPIVLFGIQFTFALLAYALAARWYVVPPLRRLPPAAAFVPLVWIHVFRIVGGAILAPGSVGPGVPTEFREMIGYGDMATAALAVLALIALRARLSHANNSWPQTSRLGSLMEAYPIGSWRRSPMRYSVG